MTEKMGIQTDDVNNEEFVIDTLEDLIDQENVVFAESSEIHDLGHNLWQYITDELQDELADKARKVLEHADPVRYGEVKDGDVFISGRGADSLCFAVCLQSELTDEHDHQDIAVIPDTVLLMDNEDFNKYLEVAQFLNDTGLVPVSVQDDYEEEEMTPEG